MNLFFWQRNEPKKNSALNFFFVLFLTHKLWIFIRLFYMSVLCALVFLLFQLFWLVFFFSFYFQSSKSRKETIETKRERKAAKTLAIITGAFVVCWLPFFLMALLLPLCGETCSLNDKVASLFLWLGYFNSTLNPVIYTIFSPEFRQAFKRILFGSHRTGYYRGGKL